MFENCDAGREIEIHGAYLIAFRLVEISKLGWLAEPAFSLYDGIIVGGADGTANEKDELGPDPLRSRDSHIPLSDAARSFLTTDIGSVERLSVLLFLHRHATRWWTAQTLAVECEMPAATVQKHLDHLSSRNLLDVRIVESVIYCYKPGREDLSELVEEVAQAHYLHRDAVVAVLTHRLADSARLFADAFQFRKDKRDG